CISYIVRNKEEDWTWKSVWGYTSTLYGSMAVSLLLKAYELTGYSNYLKSAKDILNDTIYSDYLELRGSNNDKLLLFTTIAEYVVISKDYNSFFMDVGLNYYNFSISQYNITTNEWYYNLREQNLDFYDSHSAYYQIINIYNILKRRNYLALIYPTQNSFLANIIPEMELLVEGYLTENGTIFYKDDTPDYTESAAVNLVTFKLIELYYSIKNDEIIASTENTILQRQLDNGAYIRTDNELDGFSIWYTDNIGEFIAFYINVF
ncbi:unnamed protein product, partial [marine sediment metagenome]